LERPFAHRRPCTGCRTWAKWYGPHRPVAAAFRPRRRRPEATESSPPPPPPPPPPLPPPPPWGSSRTARRIRIEDAGRTCSGFRENGLRVSLLPKGLPRVSVSWSFSPIPSRGPWARSRVAPRELNYPPSGREGGETRHLWITRAGRSCPLPLRTRVGLFPRTLSSHTWRRTRTRRTRRWSRRRRRQGQARRSRPPRRVRRWGWRRWRWTWRRTVGRGRLVAHCAGAALPRRHAWRDIMLVCTTVQASLHTLHTIQPPEAYGGDTDDVEVADRYNIQDFVWETSSRRRFVTYADFLPQDRSPYRWLHARRESSGGLPCSRTVFCRAVPNPTRPIRDFHMIAL
jgi:hypothetical protein